jgi:ADP-ribosylglycohydrolase
MPTQMNEHLNQAHIALEGLSVGDAFGRYRLSSDAPLPVAPWPFTDDTNMALSIFSVLRQFGEIDQDKLALSFAQRYDYRRGYGPAMHRLLDNIGAGMPWHEATSLLFEGQGSYGNGAAMRVAPIGAYFMDDMGKVIEQARLSAEITHAHPEGIAGAVAIAVATALACRLRGKPAPSRREFIDLVLTHIPDSMVREKTRHARDLAPGSSVMLAVAALGNGSEISAQDTVPFTLWCAGEQIANYEQALWLTVSAQGDADTNCAIVGGIVAAYTGIEGIPETWLERRESLPTWAFEESL